MTVGALACNPSAFDNLSADNDAPAQGRQTQAEHQTADAGASDEPGPGSGGDPRQDDSMPIAEQRPTKPGTAGQAADASVPAAGDAGPPENSPDPGSADSMAEADAGPMSPSSGTCPNSPVCDPERPTSSLSQEPCGPCGSGVLTITTRCADDGCSFVEERSPCEQISAECDPGSTPPMPIGVEACGPCNKGTRAIVRSCSESCTFVEAADPCDESGLCVPRDLGSSGYRCTGPGVWEWCYDSDVSSADLACTWTGAPEPCAQSSCPPCYE